MVLSQGKGVQTLPSHPTRAKGSGNRKSEHNTSLIMFSRAFKTLKKAYYSVLMLTTVILGTLLFERDESKMVFTYKLKY